MPVYLGDLMKTLTMILASVLVLLSTVTALSAPVQANGRFPTQPDGILTPGELCSHPDARRYPERIAYCNRDVASDLKKDIIDTYDKARGFQIGDMPRAQFKIDHYIPLCAGGSNDRDNLWPQHESVYTITDPLEALICQKMSEGKLKQVDAVATIKKGKANLDQVPEIISQLNKL